MVKSLNLGLKGKVLGPLLAFMGVGGPARAQAKVKGVTVGVGGWARKLASNDARSAFKEWRRGRRVAAHNLY